MKRINTMIPYLPIELEFDNICTNSNNEVSNIIHNIRIDFDFLVVSTHIREKFRVECIRMNDRIDSEK